MEKEAFVDIKQVVLDCIVDLRYATKNNFTRNVIYPFQTAYVRLGTAEKLAKVQQTLSKNGYSLVVWDAYRPVSAQFALWACVPDPTFVADPTTGFSNHSRGNTVDITLADKNGVLLEMPTMFDAITPLASRAYEGITSTAKSNAMLLERVMCMHGFTGYFHEWWHYEDVEEYPVEHTFLPSL